MNPTKCYLLAFSLLLFAGCSKTELSEVKFEQGSVISTQYVPSKSNLIMMPIISPDGEVSFVWIPDYTPEQHLVILEWKWGQLTLDDADLWKTCKVGCRMIISYQEVYKVAKDGTKTLKDRKFINAKEIEE